ncbi:MAG: DUF4437 domain-containing protein [Bacteroidota bacterium]
MVKRTAYVLVALGALHSCGNPKEGLKDESPLTIENPTNRILLSSEIVWEKLNPARGDQSPQAGTLWGDRRGREATGFLAKFVDGFSSPAHIHNVTYRAVVIKGLVHNDDPQAENMWMGPGSFWTQPSGESHITAAKGAENIALVEINQGPYLVKPTSEAFDNGESPVNIEASNVVWLNAQKTNWVDPKSKAEMSFLLERESTDGPRSLFIKLPKGYTGEIESTGTVFHAVVIAGKINYTMPQTKEIQVLDVGSYFGATDKAIHSLTNTSEKEVVFYVRANGKVTVR